ncbi:MAG TPA: PilN domain-containing protein [Solirubrobacteraceae bacterium]|jgi:Tfp pilus assembly protein PilN
MKAVNLLPREAQRSFGTLRGLGAGTTALLGALSLACVVAVAYVVMANAVTSKRDELTQLNAQQAAAERQVATLKPYADLEQARTALLEQVRTLATGRFDWPQTLARIARAIPADAKLTSLNGSAGGATGSPSIALSGCTPSHDSVAGLIDRLRAVQGVAGVSLQSSKLNEDGKPAAGACPKPEQFEMTVALKAPEGAAAAATGQPGQTAAATPAQPAPATQAAASTTTANATPAGGTQ